MRNSTKADTQGHLGTHRNCLSQRRWQLPVLFSPTFLYLLLFHYWPLYGVLIAFTDFRPYLGIWRSEWVGLDNFRRFLESNSFWKLIANTLSLSVYGLVAGWPVPIALALGINYLKGRGYGRVIQTVTYAPHFISSIVIVGMMNLLFSPSTGIVNSLLHILGVEPIFFMGSPQLFSTMYVWSGIWQNMGWNSIVYLAALTAIDPTLHEAATMDGATKWKRIWHIDLPGISSTIMILLILNCGRIMNLGFEKVFLMQNPLNIRASEIISTYVYKTGLLDVQYSYGAAIDLFNSVVNLTLLLSVNFVAKRIKQSSLW